MVSEIVYKKIIRTRILTSPLVPGVEGNPPYLGTLSFYQHLTISVARILLRKGPANR